MRRTEMPNICCEKLFVTCAKRIKKLANRKKLVASRGLIGELKDGYVVAAKSVSLHELARIDEPEGVPNNTWQNLYKNHMAKPRAAARSEYERLMLAPVGRICPFCSIGTATSLDHILPKGKFPRYAVLVPNLVACCQDCNRAKDQHVPSSEEDHLFHPYFESVDGRWLSAEMNEESPPSVTYKVNGDFGLDVTIFARIKFQFVLLGLGVKYASQAANELSAIEQVLSDMLAKGGVEAVRADLESRAESASKAELPVEWMVALYEAAAGSDWFCKGGFRFRA